MSTHTNHNVAVNLLSKELTAASPRQCWLKSAFSPELNDFVSIVAVYHSEQDGFVFDCERLRKGVVTAYTFREEELTRYCL